jgi:Peptidase A4 family
MAPSLAVIGLVSLMVLAQLVASSHQHIASEPIDTKKIHAVHTTPTPVAAKPAPAATPAPAPVKSPAPATASSKVTVGARSAPTVTPSPSSSVSSLAPVTSTPSSGSSTSTPTPPTTTGYTSTNWSGYLATVGSYTAISGSWTVPSATGGGTTSADAAWIGIGGVTGSDLIQVGTQDTVSPSGQATSSAFYEMLPSASITVPGVSVSAGDSMTASINEVSVGQWTILITDNTNGQSFTINVAYSSSNSSAEWIEEDPSFSRNRLVPFDDYGSVSFNSASTVSGSSTVNLNSGDAQPVTMVNQSNQTISKPSAIGGDGASFSVTHE